VWRRRLVGSSSALLVASWGICVLSYAIAPPTAYDGEILTAFIALAVAFTCLAGMLIRRAWAEGERTIPAVTVTLFAIPAVLWLALVARLG
jgi:hypothetical protein